MMFVCFCLNLRLGDSLIFYCELNWLKAKMTQEHLLNQVQRPQFIKYRVVNNTAKLLVWSHVFTHLQDQTCFQQVLPPFLLDPLLWVLASNYLHAKNFINLLYHTLLGPQHFLYSNLMPLLDIFLVLLYPIFKLWLPDH